MNLETQSALFLAVFGVVIAAVAADRGRGSRALRPFLALTAALVAWAVGYAMSKFTGAGYSFALAGGLLVTPACVWMTRALLGGRGPIGRTLVAVVYAAALAAGAFVLVPGLAPADMRALLSADIVWQLVGGAWVFVPAIACLAVLFIYKAAVPSAVERRRISLIFYVGFAVTMAALLEYANRWGMGFPPVTRVAVIGLLYVLFQSGLRSRSFALQELVGKVVVFVVSALLLTAIFGVLVYWVGNDPALFVFNTLAASLVILLIYEPILSRLEASAADLFFRERRERQQRMQDAITRMAGLVRAEDLHAFVLGDLAQALGVEHARLYVAAEHGPGLVPAGPGAESDRTAIDDPAALAALSSERIIDRTDAEAPRALRERMDAGGLDYLVPLVSQDALRGAWGVALGSEDEGRSETVDQLLAVAPQIALQIENTRITRRLLHQERLATLGEMAAGLAHEIKNPLGTLKGAAQILAGPGEADPRFTRVIVEETDRLNTTLTRFLDYARPNAPVVESQDINELVRRTLDQFEAGIAAGEVARVRLVADLDPGLAPVDCDGEQIKQVLVNLLQNAIQATGEGGEVRVSTAPGARGDATSIAVADDGPGIDAEALGRLFSPFVTTRRGGSGLGLAISKRIVDSHSGSIEVATGSGTTFTVRLPRRAGS